MAIAYAQEALDLCSDRNIACPTVMVLYASILGVHAVETGKLQDMHRAISICRGAMPLLPITDHPLSISAHVTLADVLSYLYEETRNVKEIDESIGLYQMICSKIRSSKTSCHSDLYPLLLSNLGGHLFSRYEQLQNTADIDEGISCCRTAMQLCSQIHLDRLPILRKTMVLLYVGYYKFGTRQILDEALDLGQQARHVTHFQSYRGRNGLLNSIASLLTAHYQISQPSGHSADEMEEIIALSREALFCSQIDEPEHWVYAGNLANRLLLQFTITGDLANLEEAINNVRKAISMNRHSEGHPAHLSLSFTLSRALSLRFQETRDFSDLEETLKLKR
jgi:hypothetical protein